MDNLKFVEARKTGRRPSSARDDGAVVFDGDTIPLQFQKIDQGSQGGIAGHKLRELALCAINHENHANQGYHRGACRCQAPA